MRKHLSLMLLLLLLITCTACGQRQTVQRMAADRITQAESVSQLQEVSDLIVVFTPERQCLRRLYEDHRHGIAGAEGGAPGAVGHH